MISSCRAPPCHVGLELVDVDAALAFLGVALHVLVHIVCGTGDVDGADCPDGPRQGTEHRHGGISPVLLPLTSILVIVAGEG